jgi:hypothetical protein
MYLKESLMLSRVFRVGAMLVVLGLMAVPAAAQQGRRGGGPGGFRGGMGRGGGAAELMMLLSAPEVRKEVKLSDEGYAAIEKLQQENQEAMRAAFGGFRRDASDEERKKASEQMTQRMKEMNEKSQALLDEVLPPEGFDRLLGLYVQLRGDSAVTGELVAKKIGLAEADREKIEQALDKARQDAFAQARQGGGQGGAGFDPEQMRARMEEFRKKSDEAARAAMTDDQKKKLEELKGAKFDFPENLRRGGGFGGPGGPGGPGGRRGGGRPDRDSNN